ncbi:MAG: YcxB family protein [Chitinophagaceae bacterium]|nr:MAG: YcxB family protein [Chitinophagaceae bacterium]
MTVQFGYEKKQVLQGLRYHFINRKEIKLLLIFINVFAIASAVLFYLDKIQPLAFLLFSVMWFLLMLIIWRILPVSIYSRSATFKDKFIMHLRDQGVELETERGTQQWAWKKFSHFVETPYFFHLYFDSRSFFLVPKDSFSGIVDLQDVRSLLRDNLGKS